MKSLALCSPVVRQRSPAYQVSGKERRYEQCDR
jgi:hypothetical protein